MAEKINYSGYRCYTCDRCATLLWSGADGLKNPINRRYIYRIKPTDVVVKDERAYCSKECSRLADAGQDGKGE